MREIWRAQRRLDGGQRLRQVRSAAGWLDRFVGRHVGVNSASSSSASGKPAFRHDRRPLADDLGYPSESPDDELLVHRHYIEEAWIAYRLKPYAGNVSIIWPVGGPSNPPWDPQALWKHFTPNFEWRTVPGNHWSMMHDHFEDTARALGEFVRSTR
jgi:hypothetical protein